MSMTNLKGQAEPEHIIRSVLDACADCDTCRYLMDANCIFFPKLYKLYDREKETGEIVSPEELRELTDLCNFCALCPCPNIRADIIRAKTKFVERDGLKFSIRVLENVERIGKLCGLFPQISDFLLQHRQTLGFVKKIIGIHRERKLPVFPAESFPAWFGKQPISGLKSKRKVAYFAGCTARYFFPDVPKAAVEVLRHNGIEVCYPEQQCCGMPSMLEGDGSQTLKFAQFNIGHLTEIAEDGYDIVCSCPTCGYMLKEVLKEGAYYSREYQEQSGADSSHIKVSVKPAGSDQREFVFLQRSIYENLLKDDGYFSSISPMKRIQVAEHTFDLGEYLEALRRTGELKTDFSPVNARTVYFPPCHLREQKIGMPYLNLLKSLPGISVTPIESAFYCCGMAGIMGFKQNFHEPSVRMGSPLVEKIRSLNPERLLTDCLSCRLQFNHLTPYQVFHPIEILKESYTGC